MFGNGACPHDAGSVKTRGVTVRPARRGMQRPEPCGGERLRPSTGGFVASDRLGRARVTRCAAHAVVVRALFM